MLHAITPAHGSSLGGYSALLIGRNLAPGLPTLSAPDQGLPPDLASLLRTLVHEGNYAATLGDLGHTTAWPAASLLQLSQPATSGVPAGPPCSNGTRHPSPYGEVCIEVNIGGRPCTDLRPLSSALLVCTVPANVGTGHAVHVRVAGQAAVRNTVLFDYDGACCSGHSWCCQHAANDCTQAQALTELHPRSCLLLEMCL